MDLSQEIKLHNTLTGQKETFTPIKKGVVKIYNCGPTVYNFPSIGNMRSYVFADILRRTFEYFGNKVEQVINITDVGHLVSDADEGEDKIEKSAKSEGKTAEEIAKFYEQAFYKDLENLNIETKNTKFPRATEHIKEQIEIIKILEQKGFTYQTSDGIYFDISKFPEYGKLGNIKINEEISRIGENKEKKNSADFALWKFSPSTGSGKPSRLQEWPSPWAPAGFPGWHIECSAMSRKYLGQPFDIHTGGIDHIPVHHNNEIAQSEAAYGVPLANFWMHNEFLKVDGEKMSKSIGNIYTLADLKKKGIHPLSFRYWLLTGKYDSPLNFTWEAVEGAQNAFEKIINQYAEAEKLGITETVFSGRKSAKPVEVISSFETAIVDDLNTPIAIALIQEAKSQDEIEKMDEVLGLNIKELAKQLQNIPSEIKKLVKEREEARKNEDWKKSDDIREEIEQKGFLVKDMPAGTKGTIIQNTLANIAKNI